MKGLPQKGYFKRMRFYLKEMYPLGIRLIYAAILYTSFILFLGKIHNLRLPLFSPYNLLGIWNIFAILLILRLMDELKDKEIDLKLFKKRPLPSGKVLESDISFSLITIIVLYLGANLWNPKAFWAVAVVLGYSLLMFKYFFIPRLLRRYLLPNLATHNPIIALILLNIVILFTVQQDLSMNDLSWASLLLLIAMYWAMFFAWEISRKIRSKEEENEYVTYSQIFGRFGAVFVAGSAQTITIIIAFYFLHKFSLSWLFTAILVIGYAITIGAHARFVLKPNPKTSKLKPFGEMYILSITIAFIADNFFIG